MNPIKTAIDLFGSVTEFSRTLGVTPQAVCFWRDGKRQIPADKCPLIERVTKGVVTCESLRPDVEWAYIRNIDPALAGVDLAATNSEVV